MMVGDFFLVVQDAGMVFACFHMLTFLFASWDKMLG
jgi:hypothetical protein